MFMAMNLSFPNPLSSKRLLPAWEEPFQICLFSLYFIVTVPVQISHWQQANSTAAGSAGLHAPSTAHPGHYHLPQRVCSQVAAEDKPGSKLFVQGLLPKERGPAEALLVCPGCLQPMAHPGTVACADERG